MALSLSTLTSPSNNSVLQEINTTADFLEGVPLLKNAARGSNAGGSAKQDTALNQPRALPLIKNPQGNLGGYLYIPNVSGNYATGPSVTIGANQTWEGEVDMVVTQWGNYVLPVGGGDWTSGFGLIFYAAGAVRMFSKGIGAASAAPSGVTFGTSFNAKYGYDGTDLYVDIDGVRKFTNTAPSQSGSITHTLELNQQANIGNVGNYAIQKAKLTVNSAVVFDCDFNGSTSIRHGDTKFACATGQVVTINQSGNDPAKIIKRSVLRFDGANDNLKGLLGSTVTEGYAFLAFSVLGGGGEQFATCFGLNSTGGSTISTDGYAITHRNSERLQSFNSNVALDHTGLFDDANGDILHEVKFKSGSQISKINNADQLSSSSTTTISSEEFSIAERVTNGLNTAFDLEFLALFSVDSVPDEATAKRIRDYINGRGSHPIFSLIDSAGYYFFDPQKLAAGDVTSWNGNITGSDLGDTNVATNVTIVQGSQTSQPNANGYSLTFEDNTQHLEWASAYTPNFPTGQTKAWQIVGTSLGTFAYLTQGSVTELNLLGNLGNASYRQAGQSYGMILLPDSATGADIEEARKLLIDRGAADGVTASSVENYFRERDDMVEFKGVSFSGVTNFTAMFFGSASLTTFNVNSLPDAVYFAYAFRGSGLTSFHTQLPLVTNASNSFYGSNLEAFGVQLPEATRLDYGFYNCSSLSDFTTTDIKKCVNFVSAWQNCSALTSFPAGAKLGTSAQNVNFTSAWLSCSGLTSFPALDLSNGSNFTLAWQGCTSLTSFPLINTSSGIFFTSAWRSCSGLTSFPLINTASGTNFYRAWSYCTSLTSFPLINTAAGTNFQEGWRNCTSLTSFPLINTSAALTFNNAWRSCSGLTSFPANFFDAWSPSSITSGVFNLTWEGCTALTAQSVENILTSIDASGKYATATGASGGSALTDAAIDIDYNAGSGSLSAATNTAVSALKGRGWSIIVNNVTL